MKKFKINWEAQDGYCGGARPQHTVVSADDFDPEQTLAQIKCDLYDIVEEDFRLKVTPGIENLHQIAEAIYAALQEERGNE